jgi:dethiobiotin synthetase
MIEPITGPPVVDGPRPERLVVVVGTGTEVGKTWVASRLLTELRAAGVRVSARKPVQSFDPTDTTTDAHELAHATGEDKRDVCPTHRWYEIAMAPPMAAELLGRPPFAVADLIDELAWPSPAPEVGLIETAGGIRSPLAFDGDTISLIEAVEPDVVVLVADAGLGTINSVRLAMDALDRASHVSAETVFLNRYDGTDELHRHNFEWLRGRCGFRVATTMPALGASVWPPPSR